MDDELNNTQKSLSIAVMALAVAIAAWLTVSEVLSQTGKPDVIRDVSYLIVVPLMRAFFVWLIAQAVLILVQKRWDTWRGAYFFAALVGVPLVVGGAIIALSQFHLPPGHDSVALHDALGGYEAKFADQSRALQDSLYALGYPEFLHPASLGAPGGLKRAQTKITKARDILAAAHDRQYAAIAEIRGKIAALPVSQASKDQTMAGFNAGLNASFADSERLWMALDSTMAEQQAMLDFLAKTKGRWKTDADKLLFYRQADLEAYRRLQQSAQTFADKAAAAAKRMKQRRQQTQAP